MSTQSATHGRGTTPDDSRDDSRGSAVGVTGVDDLLQLVVADLVVLSLYGKNAHWNVSGPGFRSAHLALDDLVANASSAADSVAERLRALGHAVDGTPQAVAAWTSPVPTAPLSGGSAVPETVRWIADLTDAVAIRIRGAAVHVAAVDAPTGDLLNAVIMDLEKQKWLLGSEL